ncbi:MAG: glycosyltransferase family 39 protein [Candidatus Omnitrophica bacterium]|nr:glycosyltransferase family 39 protein [Candidatus Omnitrophota bacterium]
MTIDKKDFMICLFIAVASLFIFTNGLNVHGFEFRDDEVFYFKSTNEMIQSGDIMSPKYFSENRFQKPILFYWFILLSYKLFGISWFSARFVSCLFASGTLVVTWLMTKSLFNRKIAYLSTLILLTVPLFFRHAKNAVPDGALNFFIALALYFFVRFLLEKHAYRYSLFFFIACALGFMVKGFAAIIVPFLTIILYSMCRREWKILKDMRFFMGIALMFLIISPWFIYMIKQYGTDYVNYMWNHETSDRLLKVDRDNFFWVKMKDFLQHMVFYIQIILQQFAPWSFLSLLGFGLAISVTGKTKLESDPIVFMLSWVFVVYFFFSFMYFTISHYMLVMSVPVAVLTSYFLLYPFETKDFWQQFLTFFRKYYVLFAFTVLTIVYSFILIFFGYLPIFGICIIAVIFVLSLSIILRSQSLFVGPMMLGLLIALIGYQTAYLSGLGLTNHTTLRKFAQTIDHGELKNYAIGIGSHDLHENELQIYFKDVKIEKYANDTDDYTRYMLSQLFGKNESVYCLITEKDYNKYLKDTVKNGQIIQQEFMLRKQLNLDAEFLKALLRFDRREIYEYFMENVILVKREFNV